jgi:CheY-like chemotaxis protein
MADPEDIRWLQKTTNDLNNLLQVIAESSTSLRKYCEVSMEGKDFYQFLRSGLERASQVTGQLAERLGGLSNRLPATEPVAWEPPQQKELKVKIENPEGSRELVLIVDDEELVLSLASRVLMAEGYRIISTRDPFHALEIYRMFQDEIALVVLDFMMPKMDGAEVFRELQKIKKDVAVMLSSGFAEQSQISAMLGMGLKGFLPKPYTHERLIMQIRSTLDILNRAHGRVSL